MPRRLLRFALFLALLIAGLGAARAIRHRLRHPRLLPIETAPIFADDFEGVALNPVTQSRLDPLKWQVQAPDQILQRTQWGQSPALLRDPDGTTFARLRLSTFNPRPEKAGRFHQSTQITSLDRWNLENGLEYETRMRADHLPRGLILGFFAYGDAGAWRKTYQKTEADFEFLSHQGGDKVWTHLWDNWNPLRDGENAGSLQGLEGANWNGGGWNTFKIRWMPDRTQWICNDILIREETAVRPGSPMGVWFNLWAPNPDWLDAYDPAVQAASTRAQNRDYYYDVDYVRVRRIPAAPVSNRDAQAPVGSGVGLRAAYFSNLDLRGEPMVRLDPRVDFGWGRYAPDSRLPMNGFSARWEGLIEPRESGPCTFTVKSRNGVRLWVDNQKIIDGWNTLAPRERSGQIALQAGKRVPIRCEMFNAIGDAGASLWWSRAGAPPERVPQSQLYPATRPAMPRFSLPGGALSHPVTVGIHTETPGATIHYTLTGRAPTASSPILPPGARLRISYSCLVRATAFVAGQVPSETARAFYLLPDITPPEVALNAPAPGNRGTLPTAATGRVSDGGSGTARVDLVITRLADGLRWKAGRWTREEWGIGAAIAGGRWSVRAGLPVAKDLKPGRYEIKAVAYDGAGNVSGARQSFVVVLASPKQSGISRAEK